MKKALVFSLVAVFALGLSVFSQELGGTWNTTLELFPSSGSFGGFLADLESEIDITYTMNDWVFGMENTFGLAGLTGLDFGVDGSLGAFLFDADIDFAPMILKTGSGTQYVGLTLINVAGFAGLSWTSTIVDETYSAGFDDMKIVGSVSIAGVSFAGTFFMEGADSEYSETVSGLNYFAAVPSYATWVDPIQTGSFVNTDSTSVGTGWKLEISGSVGGATLTGRGYFNLSEWSLNYYYGAYVGASATDLSYTYSKAGIFSIVCDDCVPRLSSMELIIEDVSFTCLELSAGIFFDCCGFSNFSILVEDIELGFNVDFDLLIDFTAVTKSLTVDPTITFENACLDIIAGIDFDQTAGGAFTIGDISIYGIGLEYSWNGITFSGATTWDLSVNPLINGGWDLYGTIESPNLLYVWQPNTDMTDVTFAYDADADTCTGTFVAGAITTSGVGYYELTSKVTQYADVWEMYSIEVDGDSCCGGGLDVAATFYFGDVFALDTLAGVYYVDEDLSGVYDGDEDFLFYGVSGDVGDVPSVTGYAGASDCDPCPSGDCSFEVDEVEWYSTWVAVADNRMFDWVRTDLEVTLGVTTSFEITVGSVIDLWGWEELNLGFEFSF